MTTKWPNDISPKRLRDMTEDDFDAALNSHFPPTRRVVPLHDSESAAVVAARQWNAAADASRRKPTFAQCCGACDQGRNPCSTPDACRRSEEGEPLDWREAADFWATVLGVPAIGAVAGWALWTYRAALLALLTY